MTKNAFTAQSLKVNRREYHYYSIKQVTSEFGVDASTTAVQPPYSVGSGHPQM